MIMPLRSEKCRLWQIEKARASHALEVTVEKTTEEVLLLLVKLPKGATVLELEIPPTIQPEQECSQAISEGIFRITADGGRDASDEADLRYIHLSVKALRRPSELETVRPLWAELFATEVDDRFRVMLTAANGLAWEPCS